MTDKRNIEREQIERLGRKAPDRRSFQDKYANRQVTAEDRGRSGYQTR